MRSYCLSCELLLTSLFFTIKQVHTHPVVTITSSNTDKQDKTARAAIGPVVVRFTPSLSLGEALLLFSQAPEFMMGLGLGKGKLNLVVILLLVVVEVNSGSATEVILKQ